MKNINTLHNKSAALNIAKAITLALLILSCISFIGCGKTDEVGTANVELEIQWLKDDDIGVRQMATMALADKKDPSSVGPLIATLKDNNKSVRCGAAWALGEIKDVRAIAPLIDALDDNNTSVRREAASALGEIGTPAVESLIAALKDNSNSVRQYAAAVLGMIKDPRAVGPLIAELKEADRGAR